MVPPSEQSKPSSACSQCRARKVRCSGTQPCDKCQLHATSCNFPPSRRGRKVRLPAQKKTVEDRLAELEALIRCQTGNPQPDQPLSLYQGNGGRSTALGLSSPLPFHAELASKPGMIQPEESMAALAFQQEVASSLSTSISFGSGPFPQPGLEMPTPASVESLNVDRQLQSASAAAEVERYNADKLSTDEEGSVLAPKIANWEHHGPGSWLSVCSSPGLAWVSQRTGVNDFTESAKEMTATWTRRLKMDPSMFSHGQNVEPDAAMAWKFVNAYFESSHDAVYGVVYKPEFEHCLHSYFRGEYSQRNDACWHALRKTIYATGCRIYLAKNSTMSFKDIQRQAWTYFQDALSAFVEIIFTSTGLLAVRTLLSMTFFAGGLGCPSLEYMLCANAARLAQAKGLHRQPAINWNMSANDVKHWNWLFWAVYCCEKHISQRAGRPSAIDDDEISCQIPIDTCPGSTIEIRTFVAIIRQAQISSQVLRRLLSVNAFRQPSVSLMETVLELDEKLRAWKEALPEEYKPADALSSFQIVETANQIPAILLHYVYYGTLISIHTVFANPWISSRLFGNDPTSITQKQIVSSSDVVYIAARNILVMARAIEIEAHASQWGAFYFPMLGLINLFIHVLKNPTASLPRLDVALLDVTVGYFGHMELVTAGDLAFPFARDVARLARETVQKALRIDASATGANDYATAFHQSTDFQDQHAYQNAATFNLDEWSTFALDFSEEMPW